MISSLHANARLCVEGTQKGGCSRVVMSVRKKSEKREESRDRWNDNEEQ